MNARQKAKMYKKEYQELEQMYMATRKRLFDATNSSVVTLAVEQFVDMDEPYVSAAIDEYGLSAFNKQMASRLFHQILDYARIEKIPCEYSDKTLVRATIKVVDLRRDL